MIAAEIGLAHLTLLDLTPPELVTVAAEAGYDFVGVRVAAATAAETPYPMEPGGAMSRETAARLADTGLHVQDIEFLTLDADIGPDRWLPALEAGAALGARTVSVVGADDDEARLADALARLTADARGFGILPTLEPITYQPVRSIAAAARLARAAGAAVLVDALHLQRFGGSVFEVEALEPELVPVLQVCDAPLVAPERIEPPARMPRGMTTDGSVLQLEARAVRAVPGVGELPLTGLVGAAPPGTPLSIEAPDARVSPGMSPLAFARRNLEGLRGVLDGHRASARPEGGAR